MKVKKWETGIDILKIICMCFIIITHCSWCDEQRQLLLFPFWIDMAVPVLMIITGYNYYNSFNNSVTPHRRKLTKNLQRILIPFSITIFLQYCVLVIFKKSFISPLANIVKGGYGPGSYYTVVMLQVILFFSLIFICIKKLKYGVIFIVLLNIFLEFIWSSFLSPIGDVFELYSKEIYRLLAFRYLGFIAAGAWYAKTEGMKRVLYKLKFFIGIFGIIIIYLWQYAGVKTYIFDNEWAPTTLPCIFLAFAYFLIIKGINVKKHKFIMELSKSTFHIYLFQMCYFGFVVPIMAKFIDEKILLLLSIFVSIPICFFGGYLFYKCEYAFRKMLNRTVPK